MKTKWENWQATFGEVTAEYEANRDWAEEDGTKLTFYLYIRFEGQDQFRAMVTDWEDFYVKEPKIFGRLDEALEYVLDVDCEEFVGEQWEEFQKMI